MYKDHSIAVVVPAYNEERYIFETLTTIPVWVDQIIVVNDASTDKTEFEIQKAKALQNSITHITHDLNQGVGASILSGYKRALQTDKSIVCVMAGDGQMDPKELQRLLDPICENRCEMSKGNRFFSLSSIQGMPRKRIFGNIFFTLLTKIGSGYWSIVDPQNGYVAVSTKSLRSLSLDRISNRYDFENDFLCHMRMIDARVVDIPIPARYRDEVSTIRIIPTMFRIFKTLWRGFWRRILIKNLLWSFTLIPIFLFLGLMGLTTAGLVGLWAISNSLGENLMSSGTASFIAILIISSSQFLLTSLILDVISEPK